MIEIVNPANEFSYDKYPCLMICDQTIVLFHEPKKGIVIKASKAVGLYCTDWIMSCFKPYDLPITIKNVY